METTIESKQALSLNFQITLPKLLFCTVMACKIKFLISNYPTHIMLCLARTEDHTHYKQINPIDKGNSATAIIMQHRIISHHLSHTSITISLLFSTTKCETLIFVTFPTSLHPFKILFQCLILEIRGRAMITVFKITIGMI